MKIQNIRSILAVLAVAGHVSGFIAPSHFVAYGSSTLTSSFSPEVQSIRAVDVAMAGQKKKKKKKSKKKSREPIAAPYTVAQGTSKRKEEMAPTVLESTKASEPVEVVEALDQAAIANDEPVVAAASTVVVESEAERLERKAAEAASKVRQETIARALLEARLVQETAEREARQKAAVVASKLRQETIARALLETRLARETSERERELALQEAARRLEASKRKQVATNRALFETRLVLQANSKKFKAEVKQRALLVARLEREERSREAIRIRKERLAERKAAIAEARQQPKAPEVEKTLQDTYAAIEDLGERAFKMLVDLGLAEISPDPAAEDYDDSYDNELVYDFAF